MDGLGSGTTDQQEFTEAEAQEEAFDETQAQDDRETSQITLTAWIQQRPKTVIITLAVLAVPYLVICSGLAILLATGLAGGTCGG